jgi:hypothetical protein
VQRTIHSNKPVQPVSTDERSLVHLLMHLSSLATGVDKITVRRRRRGR